MAGGISTANLTAPRAKTDSKTKLTLHIDLWEFRRTRGARPTGKGCARAPWHAQSPISRLTYSGGENRPTATEAAFTIKQTAAPM